MMKTVKEVLTEMKGADNVTKTLTGKGSFSQAGFSKFVHAMANDTSYQVPSRDKNGQTISTNISELLREDIKRSIINAKYPQKSEIDTVKTSEIATNGLAESMGHIVLEYMKTGRKFQLPPQNDMNGEIYLNPVPAGSRNHKIKIVKTGEDDGSTLISHKDYIQVRAKSSAPKHLVTKVRKDKNGNIVKNAK
jgi:hypothetical protein